MRIFFLDVASHEGLLACVTEERVVAHRAIDHRIGDHELVPLMEDVVKEMPTLTHLACVIGPGGFTSLRVGVSCINALSWSLKIPVAGVHLSDLYAARMPPTPRPPPPSTGRGGAPLSPAGGRGLGVGALWLHSTKRTELFIRGFGDFAYKWPQPTHVTLDELFDKFRSPTTYVGELLPEHRAALEESGCVGLSPCPVMDVLPRFLSSLPYKNEILQPWYGRGW